MMKKRNILITAIGSFSADCAVRELKKQDIMCGDVIFIHPSGMQFRKNL